MLRLLHAAAPSSKTATAIAAWPAHLNALRHYSSSSDRQDTAIYHSTSTNPWFNLAYEDWIFRKTPASQIVLFIYRNSPSVIIGRNQNPWREINLRLLRQLDIPFVRRRSGGGTVYHDLGNSNYCVFMPRTQFERRTNALLVSDALNNLDVNTYVNDRNDICIDGFKVSGSAFKLVNARAYHHGTMLIDAKLKDLKGVLSNEKASSMTSKGVESVPSPVRNLREWDPYLDHQSFFDAVADQFIHVYGGDRKEVHLVDEGELKTNDYVKNSYEELQSWEWQWGQTPEFTIQIKGDFTWGHLTFNVTAHHGIVTECSFTDEGNLSDEERQACETICESLRGQKYEDVTAVEKLAADFRSPEQRQVFAEAAATLKAGM